MKTAVPLTVVLITSVFLALGCVADASLALTPTVVPQQLRPQAPPPNLPPIAVPTPSAPAAGTYFGQVNGVDPLTKSITFSAICLGADRKAMKELLASDKTPRLIPMLSTTEYTVFSAPPNRPEAGHMSPVPIEQLAEIVRATPTARFFMIVEPQGVKALEMDSGIRPSPQPDDPCPHL